jgi:hypothetical protein
MKVLYLTVVVPKGLEPPSREPESPILSVELRNQLTRAKILKMLEALIPAFHEAPKTTRKQALFSKKAIKVPYWRYFGHHLVLKQALVKACIKA